jgi:uncharacterized protein (DUF4415 family)
MAKKHLTDRDGEVRELTRADIAEMKPFPEAFPALHESWKRGKGRPRKDHPKERLTMRLDADIVAWVKQKGKGYQTRINAILRDAMAHEKGARPHGKR